MSVLNSLNKNEQRVIQLCSEFNQGITYKIIQNDMPHLELPAIVDIINKLLAKNLVDLLTKDDGSIFIKIKDPGSLHNVKGAEPEEQIVYKIIEESGTRGIWAREIRAKCNLHLNTVEKVLRKLESKKLIKSFNSVAAPKKKTYLLFNLEPDQALTGGAWYSDQHFDSEFVDILNQQCRRYLDQRAAHSRQVTGGPLAVRNASFVSSKDVLQYIIELGITKVKLTQNDIETILETLMYDGKVEKSVACEGVKLYRSVSSYVSTPALVCMPCGVCPGSAVNGISYKKRSAEISEQGSSSPRIMKNGVNHSLTNGSAGLESQKNFSTPLQEVKEKREKWQDNYVPTPYFSDLGGPIDASTANGILNESQESFASDKSTLREHWSSYFEFLAFSLALSLGIGNVWRFPYLAYENGGGSFLVSYIIVFILTGIPLYLTETVLGQYSQWGPIKVWRCSPCMQGVGIGMLILSTMTSVYFMQLMAYAAYYLFATLAYIGYEIPWSKCNDNWASQFCFDVDKSTANITGNLAPSTFYFWEKEVLKLNEGGLVTPGEIGGVWWDLTLCRLLSMIIAFVCLIKGARSSGKVAYGIAALSFCVLIAALVMSVISDGAAQGVTKLYVPNWVDLTNAIVWWKAAEQVLFSLMVSWGCVITMSSQNKFKDKVYVGTLIVVVFNFLISLIVATIVFAILGVEAEEKRLTLADINVKGPGIIFIAFSAIVSKMTAVPHLFAFFLFLTLFASGLSSVMALLHNIRVAVCNHFILSRRQKVLLAFVLSFSCFLLGLPLCASKGIYIFGILDTFAVPLAAVIIAIFEFIAVHWVYGVRRFSLDYEFMIGYSPFLFWKVLWCFVGPLVLIVLFVITLATWEYKDYGGATEPWVGYIGWALFGVTVLFIPLVFLSEVLCHLLRKNFKNFLKPSPNWGPGCKDAQKLLFELKDLKFGIVNPAASSDDKA